MTVVRLPPYQCISNPIEFEYIKIDEVGSSNKIYPGVGEADNAEVFGEYKSDTAHNCIGHCLGGVACCA